VPHSLLSHPIEGSKPSAKIADAMAYPYIAPEVTLIGGLMTAELPPYMNAYGNIVEIFKKFSDAATPTKVTVDFLGTELGFTGGGARPFIPFAKRLGLIGSDGTPTELCRRFRNPLQSKFAIAEAMRIGYPQLFRRNEYAHSLDKDGLAGLVAEATGLEAGTPTLRSIVSSFLALKAMADFANVPKESEKALEPETKTIARLEGQEMAHGLKLSYTITLNLPNTNDISVFNAIFKALRDNLT
jgi:hypothetical protein